MSTDHLIPMHELLTPDFVSRRTAFANLDELLCAGGVSAQQLANMGDSPAGAWNEFIRASSAYPGWQKMLRDAGAEWMIRRMGIIVDV